MVHSAKMGGALKILERMVNQNAQDEIFQDFKYWEVIRDYSRKETNVAGRRSGTTEDAKE